MKYIISKNREYSKDSKESILRNIKLLVKYLENRVKNKINTSELSFDDFTSMVCSCIDDMGLTYSNFEKDKIKIIYNKDIYIIYECVIEYRDLKIEKILE